MKLADALLDIADRHGGRLEPEVVVDESRPPSAPLHHRFEWDDAIAAEAHRLDQARQMIRSVRISYVSADEQTTSTIRAWLPDLRPHQKPAYVPADVAVADPIMLKLLTDQAMREAVAFRTKYSHLEAYADIVKRLTD